MNYFESWLILKSRRSPCPQYMALLSEQERAALKPRIEEILHESNLENITAKSLRQQLENEDSKNYSENKDFFVEVINECLERKMKNERISGNIPEVEDVSQDFKMAMELQKQEEQYSSQKVNLRRRASGTNKKYQEGLIIKPSKSKKSDDNSGRSKELDKPKSRVLNKPLLLSSEMAAVFDNEYTELTRPEVVKKIWDYIKLHQLQDPKDRRFILCDDRLMSVFNRPRINCFKMAKFLSAHLFRKEDVSQPQNLNKAILEKTSNIPSPKKQKMSMAVVEDSDEEAAEHELLSGYEEEHEMNPLLLQIPGVTADMSYSALQAAVLAFTQVSKLRLPTDTDLIVITPNSPISKLMGPNCGSTVHILDLILRVNSLYSGKDNK